MFDQALKKHLWRTLLCCSFLFLLPQMALSQMLTDPTKPYHYRFQHDDPSVADGVVLTSIFFSPTRKVAILNDQLVHVGDKIGHVMVRHINQYTVMITDQRQLGKQYTLSLYRQQIKTPSKKESEKGEKK